jgi:hypothetical protein
VVSNVLMAEEFRSSRRVLELALPEPVVLRSTGSAAHEDERDDARGDSEGGAHAHGTAVAVGVGGG